MLGQHRSTQRKAPKGRVDDAALTADVVALATQYGRYGCRRIAAMLQEAGWAVNVKRVERRDLVRHGSKDKGRAASGGAQGAGQATKERAALAERGLLRAGSPRAAQSCLHLTASSRIAPTTARKFRMRQPSSTSSPRECLAIRADRKLKSADVIDVLSDRFILRGVPGHVRSDNGPEFIAKAVREWIAAVGARTAFIAPGSPWENGTCESFNSKLCDELLNGELFHSLAKAKIVIERWRQHDNTRHPHSSLGYKPPAPDAVLWPGAPPISTVAAKPTMH